MANELGWLRAKARLTQTDTMVVTEARAIDGCPAGTYKIEFFAFKGIIPYRMAKALRGSKLINTETENESLRLGNGYRGGEGHCEYYRTVYERVA
jgi:hypothetical protein